MSVAAPAPPEPKFVLRDGMASVSCIEFCSDDTLYAGTQDGYVHVWNLNINRRQTSFRVGDASCLAVRNSPFGLITQTKGEGIKLWNAPDAQKMECEFKTAYLGFCQIEINLGKTCLFLPEENSEVKVFELHGKKILNTLRCSAEKLGEIMVMKYTNYCNKDILFTAYESGDIYLWDSLKGIISSHFKLDNVPMALDFDKECGKGVCGSESDSAIVFQIDRDLKFSFQKSLALKNPGVSSVVIRPDQKICVLGCWDGNLRVYSWKSGRLLGVLSEHKETVNALCYSSKPVGIWGSILLAAASKDGSVSLWSFY